MRWIDVRDYLEAVRGIDRSTIALCDVDKKQTYRLPVDNQDHDVVYVLSGYYGFRHSIFANCSQYLQNVRGIVTKHNGKTYYLKGVTNSGTVVWTDNNQNAQTFATVEQGKKLLASCTHDNRDMTFCIFLA